MINSRKPEDLAFHVQVKAQKLLQSCRDQGIDLILTSTYRDFESQNALYAQGRTTPGKIVTNAKGGDSVHNYRMAFDVVPIVGGKAVWDDEALWDKVGQTGKAVGLEWAGDWKSFKEKAHFQDTQGMPLKVLKAKYPEGITK